MFFYISLWIVRVNRRDHPGNGNVCLWKIHVNTLNEPAQSPKRRDDSPFLRVLVLLGHELYHDFHLCSTVSLVWAYIFLPHPHPPPILSLLFFSFICGWSGFPAQQLEEPHSTRCHAPCINGQRNPPTDTQMSTTGKSFSCCCLWVCVH